MLQKGEEKYHNCGGKAKSAEYYIANKDVSKEKAKNRYRNLSEEEQDAKKRYSRDRDTRKLKKNWEVNYKNELLLV